MRPLLKVLLAVLGLFVLTGAAGGAWFFHEVTTGPGGAKELMTIPDGASTTQIASLLEKRHVISSARLFKLYVRIKGAGPFKAGDYTFPPDISMGSVIGILDKGPGRTFQRLTIPEGLTLKEVADRVGQLPGRSAATFLQIAQSGTVRSTYQPAGSTNLEGLLFPDTYFIDPKDDETAILRRMVSQFDVVAAQVGLDDAATSAGVSPYQAAIVASLIETEGKVEVDRPKIGRVIYNRLARQMPLQIDATVIYAKGGGRRPNGQVLFSDLETNSPYNTYKVKGLPPTPIAVVGRASLTAALHPADGPWLYYVKFQTDGTHAFATTLEEQNRNIADARRRGVNP